jgi:hypothetical protein
MKTLGRLTAGAVLILATGLGAPQFANAAVVTEAAPASSAIPMAGASCIVTGYTLHAEEEMAKDRITSDQVETVVHNTCRNARKQSNGRYKYTDGKITVIAEQTGYVITVWRN